MTAETIFIHAGLHKTGSTALQSALWRIPFRARRAGLSVWRIEQNHNAALRVAFGKSRGARGEEWRARLGTPDAVRAHLRNALSGSARKFLLTSEILGMFPPADLTTMRDWLRATAPNARLAVIVYVRRLDRHLSSFAQHQIRRGHTIEQAIADTRIIRFRERIGHLFDIFGRQSVDVRLCPERDTDGKDALFADFASALGVSIRWPRRRVRQNESLSQSACELLDRVNAAAQANGSKPRDLQGFMAQLRNTLPGPSFRLSGSALRTIVEQHRDGIDWLYEHTGIRLALPDDLPDESETASMPRSAAVLERTLFQYVGALPPS